MIKGLGIDLVSIERLEKLLSKYDQQTLGKVFTERELTIKQNYRLAGRFAAKEALSKALGSGIGEQIWFNEIEITNNEKGKPNFTITPKLKQLLKKVSADKVHVSISHEKNLATAIVILE